MAKNPWLSLWLSAANTWAGAARGFWTAEMQRQQNTIVKEVMRSATRPASKSRTARTGAAGARKKRKS